MLRKIDTYWVCTDCQFVIEFGSDTHLSVERNEEISATINAIDGALHIDEDEYGSGYNSFSKERCECCASTLAGARYRYSLMRWEPPKRETNEAFMIRIMNFGCPTGALIQPFIIQALASYSEKIIGSELSDWDTPLISSDAWKATAQWLKDELDKNYGGV